MLSVLFATEACYTMKENNNNNNNNNNNDNPIILLNTILRQHFVAVAKKYGL